ncbi:MAG TPA: hypothetical protein IAA32_09190, partial [Candidatus Butyricicoccus stercorigallinarum]|nr:hypothetical protein [Candidatus Butyricicoccus stercorigallinarum]
PVFQGAIASSSLVASLRAADHSEERRRSPSFLSPQLLSIPQPLRWALKWGANRQSRDRLLFFAPVFCYTKT